MRHPPSILVVDDEPGFLRYMVTMLEAESFRVESAISGPDAVDRLKHGLTPELVLLDVLMPEMDGLETLERLRQIRPELKVVMLSCVTQPRKVVQALRLGAQDYLAKPFQKAELDAVLQHNLRSWPAEDEPVPAARGGGVIEELGDDLHFVAAGAAIRKVRAQIQQVAAVDVPVLLLGESGTGKEVAARLIHKLSSRASRVFLKVNCAALPADLLESELFGYEAGAFTGATRSKPGKFELSDGGTILLDEIGEMPPALQAKLLHVLQDHEFSRLGSRVISRVDVRILAATNLDVRQALASGKLREDLYYRLNTFTIQLPPLRERQEEIPLLLRHFMWTLAARFGRDPLPLSSRLIDTCLCYPWPGNLRELESFVKRYLILSDEELVLSDLVSNEGPPATAFGVSVQPPSGQGDLKTLVRSLKDQAEIGAITRALEQVRWNRKKAASILNISYKALLYKIRQYGIHPVVALVFLPELMDPSFLDYLTTLWQ